MDIRKQNVMAESTVRVQEAQLSPHCRYLYHNRFSAGPDYVITSHEHLFWHVEFVRRGVLETVVGAKVHTTLPGSALMLPPQVSHSFVYREPDTTVFSVKYELHNLPLPPQAIAVEQSTFLDALVAALDDMLAGTRPPEDARIEVVNHLLAALVHVSVRTLQPSGELSRLTLVDRILAAIENAEGRNMTVAGLARDLGFSQTYLRTQFRRQEGVSLKEFIDRHRVNAAVKYLSYSDMPIKEIVSLMEFPDPQCFSRFCRRLTGRNPREIRRTMRAGTNMR